MTTNGYPPSNQYWDQGDNEPTMQFDRVESYNTQPQGYWEDDSQQPYYAEKQRSPMLMVLVIVTVLVFIILASAAFLAYKTMSEPPISALDNTTSSAAETTAASEATSERKTSSTTSSATTSKSSSEKPTPGAAPGSRPAKANLPDAATPVNSAAQSGAEAGYLVNLYKSGDTSDEFANAVHQKYLEEYAKPPTDVHTVTAKSPVTGKTYEMKCKDEGSYVHCQGGVGAHVYIA